MMRALRPPMDQVRATTWLHRTNPIVKLVWLVAAIAFAFATYHPIPLLVAALAAFVACVSAGVGRDVARILLVFAPIAASMLVIETLAPATCAPTCAATVVLGPFDLFAEGMTHGLSLAARLLVVEVVALGVLLTTHPSDLFAALARLRVPYLLNFMVSMTLQLVPILQREVATVLAAQRSRGMRGRGFGAVIPSFVPVFAGAFERVQQLSISLESRAFGSSGRATSFRRIGFGPVDVLLSLLGLAAGAVGVAAGIVFWNADRTASLALSPTFVAVVFIIAAIVLLGVLAAAIRAVVKA
jgi:energy-coupling factor transport system permease protein